MVHSKENGHRLRLVKQMEQLSLVEISKLKCFAHSVQSPKKRFLFKKRKKRTSKTTRQQQELVATSPWSGFMWGIKQGFMHSVCTLGRRNTAATTASCKTGGPSAPSLPAHSGPADTLTALSTKRTAVYSSSPQVIQNKNNTKAQNM